MASLEMTEEKLVGLAVLVLSREANYTQSSHESCQRLDDWVSMRFPVRPMIVNTYILPQI